MCPKILLSIDERQTEWLDNWVNDLNSKRDRWKPRTNRQAVIAACIDYAIRNDFEFSSGGYSKHAYIEKPKDIKN